MCWVTSFHLREHIIGSCGWERGTEGATRPHGFLAFRASGRGTNLPAEPGRPFSSHTCCFFHDAAARVFGASPINSALKLGGGGPRGVNEEEGGGARRQRGPWAHPMATDGTKARARSGGRPRRLLLDWRVVESRARSSEQFAQLGEFGSFQATGFEVLKVREFLNFSLQTTAGH